MSDKLGREKLKSRRGGPGVKKCQKLGSQNVQNIDFCYIVVSTFFAESGPPPDPPKSDIFGPPLEQKYRRFCGEWDFQ
jgi:hypothetical protein